MSKEIEAGMYYKDMKVVISQGIGEGDYYVMAVKPNGSHKRILNKIKGNADANVVLEQLKAYKKNDDWKLSPQPLTNDHGKSLRMAAMERAEGWKKTSEVKKIKGPRQKA